MTTWHLDRETAQRYAIGAAGPVVSASVEAHLTACSDCRALLVPLVDGSRLRAVWADVEERVDTPVPGVVERLLCVIGVGADTARLLAATPSLRGSWLLAIAAALAFAVLASQSGPRGILILLMLAPMLPVAGVAVAYGRGVDPIYEIGAAAPYSGFRLVLLRTAAVVATTALLSGTAGWLLPGSGWTGAAWLLPAFALTALTLALSVRVALIRAGAVVGVVWVVAVVLAQAEAGGRLALAAGHYAAFGAAGQLVCLAIAGMSIAVLVIGRQHYLIAIERTS